MEVNMLTIKKSLSTIVLLFIAACTSLPEDASPAPTQVEIPDTLQAETPEPATPKVEQGTLPESILAGMWKGNSEGHFLLPIGPTSGQALADYEPISLGLSYSYAFSPDQRRLAVVGYISEQGPHGGNLHLIDLETWEEHFQELQLNAYVSAMGFSSDGERLAIAYGNVDSQILVLNVADPPTKSKSAALQTEMDFLVNQMKFTSDGSGLMIYGYRTENPSTVNQQNPDLPQVALLDSTDLSVSWRANLEGVEHGIVPKDENSDELVDITQPGQAIYYFPGLAFAPEKDTLYVVHASEEVLTTVDFSKHQVSSVEIEPQLSWMDQLLSLTASIAHAKVAEGTTKHVAISPDGETLYIVGQNNELGEQEGNVWNIIENPLGLEIVRAKDGSRVARYDTEASDISISYDGSYLFLQGWNQEQNSAWTQIFNARTNESVTQVEDNTWLVPTRRLNGEPILASSDYINGEHEHHYETFDPDELSVITEWNSEDYLVWLRP
jgi:WD40 repeat protein